jgi:F0F1-type ATP synthase epsilon subunit
MPEEVRKFKLSIMDPDRVIFEGEASNLFLKGDTGEFELQPFHYPVLSVLAEGDVIIDWKYRLPIRNGIVRFFMNECVLIVEKKDE